MENAVLSSGMSALEILTRFRDAHKGDGSRTDTGLAATALDKMRILQSRSTMKNMVLAFLNRSPCSTIAKSALRKCSRLPRKVWNITPISLS